MTALIALITFLISGCALLYAYLGYPVLLRFLARRLKVRGHVRDEAFKPKVTVLIPVYNEEKVIKQKLENCLELEYPQDLLEIMVCSDCSTDRTATILRSFTEKNITFHDYRQRSGKTGVINKSISKARGEIIVLTDANTMFNRDAVSKMVSLYSSPEIGAVCGLIQVVIPRGSHGIEREITYRDFEAELKYLEGLFGATMGAFGGFYSIRKELFEPLPDNAYSNDDFLISMNILNKGHQVLFDKDAVATEDSGPFLKNEFLRRIRIGVGNFQSFSLLTDMLTANRGLAFVFYVSHKVLRWFSPFILILFLLSNCFILEFDAFVYSLYLQIFFYISALIGIVVEKFKIKAPGFLSIYYFVSMNIALLLGFFRYLGGVKSAAWQSTERNAG